MKKQLLSLMLCIPLISAIALPIGCNIQTPPNPDHPSDCVSHADTNNDGLCDSCQKSVIEEIELYAINDLHGKILENDSQPGVANLTTYLKQAKQANDNTIIFSSGDMWQGSAESSATYGQMMLDWMDRADFEFMTLGNHEFDWSSSIIKQNANQTSIPFLAINVYERATSERASYAKASHVVDLGEVQVGFIGAIGDCYSSISGDMSTDIYFKTGDELTELVKAESRKLKDEGVDLVIYSIHDGYDDSSSGIKNITDSQLSTFYDISLSGDYVDIVFEGHTHQNYIYKDSKGVYHLQGGGENRGLSWAKISYNTANAKYTVAPSYVRSTVYSKYDKHPVMDELLTQYKSILDNVYRDVGYNSSRRNSTYLCNLNARLYLELGEKTWGSKYDIVLGGGKLSCRSPYNLEAGKVQYSMLYSLFPFNNKIVLCSISGIDLLNRYISNESYCVYYSQYGQTVKSNVNYSTTYYIITDTYNSSYTYNNLTVVETYDDTTFARDLLADYISLGGLE